MTECSTWTTKMVGNKLSKISHDMEYRAVFQQQVSFMVTV